MERGILMKPIVGIAMGDPCGIGPEITAKALADAHVYELCRPIVIGSAKVFRRAVDIVGAALDPRAVEKVSQARFLYGQPEVLNQDLVDLRTLALGEVQAQGGRAAYMAVEQVIRLAMAREIDATVTAPLNKEALNLAGFHYSGHTEIYAALTGTKDYAMMLMDGPMRVVHVSTHVPLRVACDLCTRARVLQVIRLAHGACRRLGLAQPRIAVAGLNPHAGENGLFSREEIEEIAPAVAQARREGMHVDGPLPADTVFSKMNGGMYDIVVVQYHDQGHIPLKLLGFRMNPETGKWDSVAGVNLTLGLPIIRVSVDHGTAFDQAGKGCANEISMRNAIECAARLAMTREKQE